MNFRLKHLLQHGSVYFARYCCRWILIFKLMWLFNHVNVSWAFGKLNGFIYSTFGSSNMHKYCVGAWFSFKISTILTRNPTFFLLRITSVYSLEVVEL